jgi:hypothetical protein
MICLHENYLPRKYPAFADLPSAEIPMAALSKAIAEEHQKRVDLAFRAAILEKCGGVLPSVEEMAARGKSFITPEGVHMLAWDHPHLELGEKVDMSYVIAQVEPPTI